MKTTVMFPVKRPVYRHIKSGKLYAASYASPKFITPLTPGYGKAKSYKLTPAYVRVATTLI